MTHVCYVTCAWLPGPAELLPAWLPFRALVSLRFCRSGSHIVRAAAMVAACCHVTQLLWMSWPGQQRWRPWEGPRQLWSWRTLAVLRVSEERGCLAPEYHGLLCLSAVSSGAQLPPTLCLLPCAPHDHGVSRVSPVYLSWLACPMKLGPSYELPPQLLCPLPGNTTLVSQTAVLPGTLSLISCIEQFGGAVLPLQPSPRSSDRSGS